MVFQQLAAMPRLTIQKAVSCTLTEYRNHAGTKVEIVRFDENMSYVNVFHGTEPMATPLVPEYTKFSEVRQALLNNYGIELPFQRELNFIENHNGSKRFAYTKVN